MKRTLVVALTLALGPLVLAPLAPARLVQAQDQVGELDVVARTRKQLAELKKLLEEIRGEKLAVDVTVKYASPETLDKESKVDIDRRYDTRADQISRAYARIGLFPAKYDLSSFMSAFASQVVAFYEPVHKTFFVVKTDLGEMANESTAIHELTHALQDQRFDLSAYYHFSKDPDPIATNDDAALARRLVVEGEASYVAMLHQAKQESALDKVDSFLEARAALSRGELSKLERRQAAQVEGGKGLLKALNACDTLPAYLYHEMLDPYLKGPAVIARVKKAGGWKAVDELYTRPPEATKQLLHPEARGKPLDPVEIPDLAVVIGSGFKRTFENTFGEMGTACILEARARTKGVPEAAAKIAATWQGDRFQAYETSEHETCAIWVTSWETKEAAAEFEVAGKEILKGETASTRDSFVERRDRRVLLVLGAPRKRTKALIEATLGERTGGGEKK